MNVIFAYVVGANVGRRFCSVHLVLLRKKVRSYKKKQFQFFFFIYLKWDFSFRFAYPELHHRRLNSTVGVIMKLIFFLFIPMIKTKK